VGNIVTSGTFRLRSWEPGALMVLERNPDYQRNFPGNVQRLELYDIRDRPTLLRMYEQDDLDLLWLHAGSYPGAEIDRARQRHAADYVCLAQLQTSFVAFDARRPPFDDPSVRQAFALATDRETLAGVVGRGNQYPATGGFVPPGMPGHSPGIALPFDPARARELLAQAGYPSGAHLGVIEGVPFSRAWMTEYLQAQWRENLGVETTWDHVEMQAFRDRISSDAPHVVVMGWMPDYTDPHGCLDPHLAWNWLGWRHEAFEALVERARQAMDQDQRLRLYQQADAMLVEEAAVVPLTYGRLHALVKPWVRGLGWLDMVIEPH
jgi:oligopeptide transport system substrate-binding protein